MAGHIVSRSRRSAPARSRRTSLALGASVAALASGVLWTPAARAQGAGEKATQLEEVVVTAQRRSESAQNVPISVAVMSSESAQAAGAVDTNSLSGKVPALVAVPSGSTLYFLRGVGTTGSSNNIEQSVATYIDGVYLYSTWTSIVPLTGTDRVEVLKGPQGTLFGRNTTGGVIQVITRDPLTASPALEASAGYGNYRTYSGSFYGAAKLNDTLGASLTVDYRNQDKGFGFNTVRNVKAMWSKNLSVQGKVVWAPIDGTKVTGFFWYDDYDSGGHNSQVVPGFKGLDGVVSNPGRFQFVANTPDAWKWKSYLGYLRLDQDFGFANFVSITSWRKITQRYDLDQDATPITVVDATLIIPAHNWSQEFQLLSKPESRLTWLLGAYFFKGSALYDPITIRGAAAAAFGGSLEEYRRQDTESSSLFGQATYEILPATRLTAGLRYTDEKEKLRPGMTTSRGIPIATLPVFHSDEVDSSGWTYRVALDHKFTQDVMGYVSYNRGLKSGGFPLVTAVNLPAFLPEKLDAWEAGAKSELFNRRLRLNLAGYYYKFHDIQVNRITTAGNAVSNAAQAELKGVDLDFEATPIANLNVYGSFGYLHGRYTDYPNAIFYVQRPTGGAAQVTANAKGKTTVYSPKWNGSFGAYYTIPTNSGDFRINGFIQYQDKQFVTPGNELPMGAYALVNGSLGWQSPNKKYAVTLWSRNLLDRKYRANVLISTVGFLADPSPPRTYGITLSTKLY